MFKPAFRLSGQFRKSLIRILSMGLCLFVSSGCTTTETQSFDVAKNANVASAQVATDADFGKYDRLMAEEMGIYFPQNAMVPAGDLQRIRQIFRTAFLAELGNYQIVQEPGPSTMQVEASLIDLRGSSSSDIPQLRRDVREIAAADSLLFLMEMRDSKTGRVLARATDSASTPSIATAEGARTDWSAVEGAAAHWARLFRQFLDQNLRK